MCGVLAERAKLLETPGQTNDRHPSTCMLTQTAGRLVNVQRVDSVEVAELVEVDVSGGLAVEEGDGLQGDEEEIGRVGTGPGEGIFGPLTQVVDVGAGYEELASLDGVGMELAGADVVAAVKEVVIAPAHVEAVVVVVSVDEEGYGRKVDEEEGA